MNRVEYAIKWAVKRGLGHSYTESLVIMNYIFTMFNLAVISMILVWILDYHRLLPPAEVREVASALNTVYLVAVSSPVIILVGSLIARKIGEWSRWNMDDELWPEVKI